MKTKKGIHYRFESAPEKPVLLFSNSLGTDFTMWDQQAEFFKTDFQILRYDTRGHGNSEIISENFSLDDLARDVIDLMDELEIKKVHFIGISIGGFTGLWLGTHYADRFLSLTLANTAPRIATKEIWENRIEQVKQLGLEPVSQTSLDRWFTKEFCRLNTELVKKTVAPMQQVKSESYIGCCRILKDTDQWHLLSQIQLPCLIIAGEFDAVTTVTEAKLMAEQIKNAQVMILPAAHLSNIESDDFNKVLLDFLTS
jgi:3-oxoadipate enol-lactonase